MKLPEKILIILFIISGILRYLKVPLANIPFTFSGLLMSIYYTFCGFLVFNNIKLKWAFNRASYSGVRGKEILTSIFAGISLTFIIFSLLFSVNKWGDYEITAMLINSLMFSMPCILLSFLLLKIKDHPTYRRILIRLIPATILSIMVFEII